MTGITVISSRTTFSRHKTPDDIPGLRSLLILQDLVRSWKNLDKNLGKTSGQDVLSDLLADVLEHVLADVLEDVLADVLEHVLADVLEDFVEDFCKLLQDGLVRFLLRSWRLVEFLNPGSRQEGVLLQWSSFSSMLIQTKLINRNLSLSANTWAIRRKLVVSSKQHSGLKFRSRSIEVDREIKKTCFDRTSELTLNGC